MMTQAIGIVLLALGFGFVIFWHELGHFLAAKAVGIKCEQFAVGFGRAIFSWRRGLGWRAGSTKDELDQRIADERARSDKDFERSEAGELISRTPETDDAIRRRLGLGETEYRLNWLPLGGYVKMLGQDDLDPNAQSADPNSFNNKSIPARMLVVSAGVLMNILLAMIGFAVVFAFGFDAPPAVVGSIAQNSPAQKAGLHVGDRVAEMNGSYVYDFTQLAPNVALSGDNSQIALLVQRPNGQYFNTVVSPMRGQEDGKSLLEIGVSQPTDLIGPVDSAEAREALKATDAVDPQMQALQPDEAITTINGQPVAALSTDKTAAARDQNFLAKRQNLAMLDQALQDSHGQPVKITVNSPEGNTRSIDVNPEMTVQFGGRSIRMAGMAVCTSVDFITDDSPVKDKLKSGDAILAIETLSTPPVKVETPDVAELKQALNDAGHKDFAVNITVQRGGATVVIGNIKPKKIDRDRFGLGVGLGMAANVAVVGDVDPASAAAKAGIASGQTISSINGKPVSNWFEIRDALLAAAPGQPVSVGIVGQAKPAEIASVSPIELADISNIRYVHALPLRIMSVPRQTSNPLQAAAMGVSATKDLLIQFYISLRRMVDGTVPANQMMGPYGILKAGTGFAAKGNVWLLWFLCMISANLAVVNFLPIPIVDGGLFTFLILEWIRGKPLSQKAQSFAQIVGLALIGFVFIFATWQDILRW